MRDRRKLVSQMPDTRAKRRKLGIQETVRQWFDAACRLDNIGSIESAFENLPPDLKKRSETEIDTPCTFKSIKEKIENASYDSTENFVTDINQLALNIKKVHGTNLWFQELNSFIEEMVGSFKMKLPHREQLEAVGTSLSSLRQDLSEAAKGIQLDEINLLQGDQSDSFDKLDILERIKLLLSWPLPGYVKFQTSTKPTGDLSEVSGSYLGTTFNVDGSKFKVGVVSLPSLLPFSIRIAESNHMDDQTFTTKYVQPYLPFLNLDEDEFILTPTSLLQTSTEKIGSENNIEEILERTLYQPTRPLLKLRLELDTFKKTISNNFRQNTSERLLPLLPRAVPSASFASLGSIDLIADLRSFKNTLSTSFLGLRVIPDMQIGYFAESLETFETHPVFLTGLGDVKYITLNLRGCIEEMEAAAAVPTAEVDRAARVETIEMAEAVEQNTRGTHTKVLSEILTKYTSIGVYIGCPRFFITDLESFLFIKLSFEEDVDLKNQEASNKATEEPLGNAAAEEDKSPTPEFIKYEYTLLPMTDELIRIKFTGFFGMNERLLDEIVEFRRLVTNKLQQTRTSVIEDQNRARGISCRPSNGDTTRTVEPRTLEDMTSQDLLNFVQNLDILTYYRVQSNPSEKDEEGLLELTDIKVGKKEFQKSFFEWVSFVSLNIGIITSLIKTGDRISQVVEIDLEKFREQTKDNFIDGRHELPQHGILKVYDPLAGKLREKWFDRDDWESENKPVPYSYQKAIDYCVNELRLYYLMLEHQGDFLPKVFSYGRVADLEPCTGIPYCRLTGPYIAMEKIDHDPNFVITKEFFKREILGLFKALHSKNLLHQDVKMLNFLISKSRQKFIIVDFSHCKISSSEKAKFWEINKVYECFGFRR